jgi:hypothetical protein
MKKLKSSVAPNQRYQAALFQVQAASTSTMLSRMFPTSVLRAAVATQANISVLTHTQPVEEPTFITINPYTMQPAEYNLPIVALPVQALPQLNPIQVLIDSMPLCPRVVLSIN